MPDVISSIDRGDVRLWVAIDQHKLSIVAATLPPSGGTPEVHRIETSARAIRRFVDRLGGPEGLAICYEAGPGGFDLLRLLRRLGVACDVVAPSLIPVRPGDRVKTDRRDANKLVRLYRTGELTYVAPPTPETEALRDLLRCREDLRRARTAARHRVSKQLLRHGRSFRDGKTQWTKTHRAWIARQRLDDTLAHRALEQILIHLDGLDRQLAQLDGELSVIADGDRWRDPVKILVRFKGISTRSALGLIAEIGDFQRFGHPSELCSWLGIVPSEYSSGDQRHRGHITKAGNDHARRLPIEAASSYATHHACATAARTPTRAPGKPRSACTTATATSPTTASAPPSRPSRSPANSPASCGPRSPTSR